MILECNKLYDRALNTADCPQSIIHPIFQEIHSFFREKAITLKLEASLEKFNILDNKDQDDFWKNHLRFLIHHIVIDQIKKYYPQTVNRFLEKKQNLKDIMAIHNSIQFD